MWYSETGKGWSELMEFVAFKNTSQVQTLFPGDQVTLDPIAADTIYTRHADNANDVVDESLLDQIAHPRSSRRLRR